MAINPYQTNLAGKMGVGYGQAQVPQQSGGMGDIGSDILKSRMFEEEKKEAEQKRKTPPKVEMGKLAPALQKVAGKDVNDFYEWYKTEGATADPATKAQKQAELNQKLMGYAVISGQYFDKQKGYDKDKISFNEQQFRQLDDYDAFTGYIDKDGNYSTDDVLSDAGSWADGFNQTETIDLTKRVKALEGIATYNEEKGGYEIPDKDNPGQTKLVKYNRVTDDMAKEILEADYNNMDAISLANVQYKYDMLPDAEKSKYATAKDYWKRQENIDQLTKSSTFQELQGSVDKGSKKGTWGDKKMFNFGYQEVNKMKDPLKPEEGRTKDVDFEEIRLARTDATENKPIYVTNPDDPTGNKVYVTPISVRRRPGSDEWSIFVEEKVTVGEEAREEDVETGEIIGDPEKRDVVDYKQYEVPWSDASAAIKANFGGFDPDTYMESITEEEDTSKLSQSEWNKRWANLKAGESMVGLDGKTYTKK